jgi:hypothetical protein
LGSVRGATRRTGICRPGSSVRGRARAPHRRSPRWRTGRTSPEAGRNPYDKKLVELIGELSTRSEDFRSRWAAHNGRFHRTGHKKLHHPVVGDLDLNFEAMDLPSAPGLALLVYTAPQGSPAADSLSLLASWAATAERTGELADGGKTIS